MIQIRSESTGLRSHNTIEAALNDVNSDHTAWKISFSLPNGERIRLIRDNKYTDRWYFEPINLEFEFLK